MSRTPVKAELLAENQRLRTRVDELEGTLEAIRSGEVDGLVVPGGPEADALYRRDGSDAPYRILVETMNEGALTLSTDGIVVFGNSHLAEMLEVPHGHLVGRFFVDFARFDDKPRFQEFLDRCRSGNTKQELVLTTAQGRELPVLCSYGALTHGTSLGLNIVVTDLSERRRSEESQLALERQLLHAQKLESLGVMAGGIAHDFNNILMAIVGHIELALLRLPEGSLATDHLKQVKVAGRRAADLTKQLLAYTGKGQFLVQVVDLNQLAVEVQPMLRVTVPKTIELAVEVEDAPAWVKVDVGQIHQVLMNLVINGADAIGEAPGKVTVAVHTEPGFVELSVTDDGCGMDEATVRKVFDPFFTTKFTGRGLGLAAVQGIVASHQGEIHIDSEQGRGTRFRVRLPAATGEAQGPASVRGSPGWRGGGKALLVEDEDDVRRVNASLLRELGFEVIEAADGREALAVVHREPDLELLVLDLILPGISGHEVLHQARWIRPHLPVLLASGHSDGIINPDHPDRGPTAALPKPFDLETLRFSLRELFDQQASRS